MNKQMKIGLIAVAVVAVLGVGAWSVTHTASAPKSDTARTAQTTTTPAPSPAAGTLSYKGVEGKTALELLKANDPKAATKGDGANAYVTTINGYTASDTKKEYWALYVNGKMSDVGAGSYVTKDGDQIEWKIATY
jgi:hypothetical protein